MFGLFQQNTPQYAGDGQPTANGGGGAFGFLGGLLAFPTAPPYATADRKPVSATGSYDPVAMAGEPSSMQVVMIPSSQTACVDNASPEIASEVLAVQPTCSVPLPVAIVIQRPQE